MPSLSESEILKLIIPLSTTVSNELSNPFAPTFPFVIPSLSVSKAILPASTISYIPSLSESKSKWSSTPSLSVSA